MVFCFVISISSLRHLAALFIGTLIDERTCCYRLEHSNVIWMLMLLLSFKFARQERIAGRDNAGDGHFVGLRYAEFKILFQLRERIVAKLYLFTLYKLLYTSYKAVKIGNDNLKMTHCDHAKMTHPV